MIATASAVAALPGDISTWVDLLKTGGISCLLLGAVIVIYRDGKGRQKRLEELIENQTAAQERHAVATATYAQASKDQAAATHRMADAVNQMIQSCRESKGLPVLPPARVEVPR